MKLVGLSPMTMVRMLGSRGLTDFWGVSRRREIEYSAWHNSEVSGV
jgi:hypothetical protein